MIRLSDATLAEYLQSVGVIPAGAHVDVGIVDGGVSNIVLAARGGGVSVIVKQALPRLNVADEWFAPIGRTIKEGRALRLFGEITPQAVPKVLHLDTDNYILVIEHAPSHWHDWKRDLLAGRADDAVSARLGDLLATWQQWIPEPDDDFRDHEGFVSLRLNPYHRSVADKVPEVADEMHRLRRELDEAAVCLVHGDFSPKNVLVGDDNLWVIDAEVAHVGHPVFDPAFLITHLILKAIHGALPVDDSRRLIDAFWKSYGSRLAQPLFGESQLNAHIGALLLSRAVGRSPAEYLTRTQRGHALTLGSSFVTSPPPTLNDALDQAAEVVDHHAN